MTKPRVKKKSLEMRADRTTDCCVFFISMLTCYKNNIWRVTLLLIVGAFVSVCSSCSGIVMTSLNYSTDLFSQICRRKKRNHPSLNLRRPVHTLPNQGCRVNSGNSNLPRLRAVSV